LNGLLDRLHAPPWTIMQGGSLGAPCAAAGVAAASGRPDLAVRLIRSGACRLRLGQGVKRIVRRGGPTAERAAIDLVAQNAERSCW
jgi:hypothetical protein